MKHELYIDHIIGEPKILDGHYTKSIHISEKKANKLAKIISDFTQWPLYEVKYTYKKHERNTALCFSKIIRVYSEGESVGIVLHELAHHSSNNHGKRWLNNYLKFIRLYENKWKNIL